jgi:hypothetical protein
MPRSGTELPPEGPDPSALRARAAALRQHARYFPGDRFADELIQPASELEARAARRRSGRALRYPARHAGNCRGNGGRAKTSPADRASVQREIGGWPRQISAPNRAQSPDYHVDGPGQAETMAGGHKILGVSFGSNRGGDKLRVENATASRTAPALRFRRSFGRRFCKRWFALVHRDRNKGQ